MGCFKTPFLSPPSCLPAGASGGIGSRRYPSSQRERAVGFPHPYPETPRSGEFCPGSCISTYTARDAPRIAAAGVQSSEAEQGKAEVPLPHPQHHSPRPLFEGSFFWGGELLDSEVRRGEQELDL